MRDGTTIFVTPIEKYNTELGAVFHCQKTPATVKCAHSCNEVTEKRHELFFIIIASKTHTKRKKITRNK